MICRQPFGNLSAVKDAARSSAAYVRFGARFVQTSQIGKTRLRYVAGAGRNGCDTTHDRRALRHKSQAASAERTQLGAATASAIYWLALCLMPRKKADVRSAKVSLPFSVEAVAVAFTGVECHADASDENAWNSATVNPLGCVSLKLRSEATLVKAGLLRCHGSLTPE